MAFRIEPFDMLEFEIPAGSEKFITISVPPVDCFSPADVQKINAELKALREGEDPEAPDPMSPNNNPIELNRFMLKYFNPKAAQVKAIDGLVARHITQIADKWNEGSGVELGESEGSTNSSSGNVE